MISAPKVVIKVNTLLNHPMLTRLREGGYLLSTSSASACKRFNFILSLLEVALLETSSKLRPNNFLHTSSPKFPPNFHFSPPSHSRTSTSSAAIRSISAHDTDTRLTSRYYILQASDSRSSGVQLATSNFNFKRQLQTLTFHSSLARVPVSFFPSASNQLQSP